MRRGGGFGLKDAMMPSGCGTYNGKGVYKMGILWKEGKVLCNSVLLLAPQKFGHVYLHVGGCRAPCACLHGHARVWWGFPTG